MWKFERGMWKRWSLKAGWGCVKDRLSKRWTLKEGCGKDRLSLKEGENEKNGTKYLRLRKRIWKMNVYVTSAPLIEERKETRILTQKMDMRNGLMRNG